MDIPKIGGVVDASTTASKRKFPILLHILSSPRLYYLPRKRLPNTIRFQVLLARHTRSFKQPHALHDLTQALPRKDRLIIHGQELTHRTLHQPIRPQRRSPIPPQQPRLIPPTILLPRNQHKLLSIPHTKLRHIELSNKVLRRRSEPKTFRSFDHDTVHLDENRATELDGKPGVTPYIDGSGAPAYIRVALEDGDIDGYRCLVGILGEVERSGRAAGASTCCTSACEYLAVVIKACKPMIATRFALGAWWVLRAPASGNSGVRRSSCTIFALCETASVCRLR
jgi:hypothetical protein